MTRLVFLSNWERTETWIEAGRALERRGIEVLFVLTRDKYVKMALAAGFPPERILWLTRQAAKAARPGAAERELLGEYERRTGDRVRDFILMDRFLRSADPAWADHYALYAFREIRSFFDKHDIHLAAGQPDNVPDLLATMILKVRGGHYAAPFEFRLPAPRFVLWDSRIEDRPHVTGAATPGDVTEAELASARALRDQVRSGMKMRQVLARSDAPPAGLPFIRRLLRGSLHRALVISRHDVYMYTLRSVLFDLKYHMIPINYRRLRRQWERLFERPVEGERFVFFTLNYAPEHTIDVEAPYFTGTEETVRNMARSLPLGVKLYVKEHPNGVGLRSPRELRRLKRLPGVRLIDPFVDSHRLIRAAELTVSLSGTASLEAALYGRPTLIISDIFIRHFSTCRRIHAPWEVGAMLERIEEFSFREDEDLRYLAWLISNSHPGTVIEPTADPDAINAENIALVADGFMKMIGAVERGVSLS